MRAPLFGWPWQNLENFKVRAGFKVLTKANGWDQLHEKVKGLSKAFEDPDRLQKHELGSHLDPLLALFMMQSFQV
ncbi:hypothetical protein L1987_40572 [Smallanthus sonchifolius]|uniref:Uncharacterized protein n=1 Tax=Smallanthus sonchifolius TaxID=185202 RepID=A0ACB9GU45_9ASTR|nr:hypothetical protein L1987_40572 [Smallanthus sonchifolius]